MKSADTGWGKRKRTSDATIRAYLEQVPDSLCLDLLNVTICCRFVESWLANARVKRYIAKYHPHELDEIQNLQAEIEAESNKSSVERHN